MTVLSVPSSTQILVIGGGPAGSYAATALAREGFSVVLLEAAKFPRYHIGESLLPSVRPFMRFLDGEELVDNYGFCVKPGAAVKLNQHKREGYTDFVALDQKNNSWNVIRSEFDDLLLRYAAKCGVSVFEETRVTELHFDPAAPKRPVAASWQNQAGTAGRVHFEYVVDASGRNGLLSTRYLKNRHYNASLHNVACWGYWENARQYMPGTTRENAVWIEALQDESGWAWFIPLHDGTASVGIVMDQDISTEKRRALREREAGSLAQTHYLAELQRAPGVVRLLAGAKLRGAGAPDAVKSASDYSYSATEHAGDRFRLVGDATAFIDPFFSSGVHLAFTGALSAAISIAASIRGVVSEEQAGLWHNAKVGTSYTRFLLVVLGTYKQIRNQEVPVMSDIDEDNFDRAFDLIRPIIQGTADVGKIVTENEVQRTMDFVRNIFAPTDPEMHEAVVARLGALADPSAPVMTEADLDRVLDPADVEAKIVLSEVNARKPIHSMYNPTVNFSTEVHYGLRAIVEQGKLGLAPP